MILLALGLLNWFFNFGFQTSLSIFAEKNARRIRLNYLKAIFKQDAQWFDNINYMELASNISKESSAIQIGCGLNAGEVLRSYATLIAGIIMGFCVAPLYTCSLLVLIYPFIFMARKAVQNMGMGAMMQAASYSQCAGYAE
jgi:ABC-type multidrug transport system fused ATPase/permease subunit